MNPHAANCGDHLCERFAVRIQHSLGFIFCLVTLLSACAESNIDSTADELLLINTTAEEAFDTEGLLALPLVDARASWEATPVVIYAGEAIAIAASANFSNIFVMLGDGTQIPLFDALERVDGVTGKTAAQRPPPSSGSTCTVCGFYVVL